MALKDITELPLNLTKNGLQYIAKQYQTIYDAYFGSDEDNSEKPMNIPFILDGYGEWSDLDNFYPNAPRVSYCGTWLYEVHINGNAEPDTYIQNLTFSASYSDANSSNDSVNATNKQRAHEFLGGLVPYSIERGTNFDFPIGVSRNDGGSYTGLGVYNPQYGVANTNNVFHISSGNTQANNMTKVTLRYINKNEYWGSYANNYGLFINLYKDSQLYVNTYNNNLVSGDTFNTYNYTTLEGDTVTTYYNDHTVIMPVVGLAGGVAYVDLKGIFDGILPDINVSLGLDGDDALYFPTYDEIKYEDMGSFYITPIKQIDNLPVAPDVGDTVPDISDYLTMVGGAVTSFYNMVDGLGVSLMLTFTFLSVLAIASII